MASFLRADLPSEDEEDADFVPDEIQAEEKRSKKQKGKRLRGAMGAAASESDEGSAEEAKVGAHKEEHRLPEAKRAEKKAKVDELWNLLNKPVTKNNAGRKPVSATTTTDRSVGGGAKAEEVSSLSLTRHFSERLIDALLAASLLLPSIWFTLFCIVVLARAGIAEAGAAGHANCKAKTRGRRH
jgi:hypothetical protein